MLDDSASFLDDLESELSDEPPFGDEDAPVAAKPARKARRSSGGRGLFGMTAAQRMVLAGMLFMMVCILGSFFLIITDSIGF